MMNENKLRRLQPRLQRIHRLSQQTGLATRVQTNVVLGGRRSHFHQVRQTRLRRGFGTSERQPEALVGESSRR